MKGLVDEAPPVGVFWTLGMTFWVVEVVPLVDEGRALVLVEAAVVSVCHSYLRESSKQGAIQGAMSATTTRAAGRFVIRPWRPWPTLTR